MVVCCTKLLYLYNTAQVNYLVEFTIQFYGAICKCINRSNWSIPSSGSELHNSRSPNETEDHMQTTDDHELVTMFEELDEDMVIASELDYTTDEDTNSSYIHVLSTT